MRPIIELLPKKFESLYTINLPEIHHSTPCKFHKIICNLPGRLIILWNQRHNYFHQIFENLNIPSNAILVIIEVESLYHSIPHN